MSDRIYKVTVRLNEKERAHLKSQASIAGLKLEPYIRKLIMRQYIKPKPPEEFAAILRELTKLNENLHAIAQAARQNKTISCEEVDLAVELSNTAFGFVKRVL